MVGTIHMHARRQDICLPPSPCWFTLSIKWRKDGDSNPGTPCGVGDLANRCFKPLSHPSMVPMG